MSYTNQTQHYGLPQYVGTDVPAWLTDVNGAFAAIDQGMNAAKTQADSAATAAGQAANDIVAINSTLGTQAGQISAAAGAAAAAQTTANSADGKADTNAQNISGIDARVSALEQGSGGLTFDTITIAGNNSITSYSPPSGKMPISAAPVQGFGTTGLTFVILKTGESGYKIVRMSIAELSAGSSLVITSPISESIVVKIALIDQ